MISKIISQAHVYRLKTLVGFKTKTKKVSCSSPLLVFHHFRLFMRLKLILLIRVKISRLVLPGRVCPFSFQNNKSTRQTQIFETLFMYLKPLVIQAFQRWWSQPDGNKTDNHFHPPQISWDQTGTYNTHSYSESGCKTLWRKSWARLLKPVISGMSQYTSPSATFSSVARSFSPKKGQCPVRLHKQNRTSQTQRQLCGKEWRTIH